MTDSYLLVLSDGTFDQKVEGDAVVVDHGLTFTGRGVTDYGLARNENILHLAENFADTTAPSNPLVGQMWFDTSGSGTLLVWNGSIWDSVVSDNFVVGGTYSVSNITGEVSLARNSGGPVVIQNAASATNLNNHITDAVDAHDASAISFVPTGAISSNTAQGAVEEIEGSGVNHLTWHINDTTDAHDASAISFVPYGSIGSNNVQAAIEELKDEINSIDSSVSIYSTNISNHIADPVDAHDAAAISFDNAGTGLSATNVQDAIDEIDSNVGVSGALETTRVRPNSTQLIGTSFTQVLFQIVDYGNASAQWNTGTSTYTAAFDQEVDIKFALTLSSSSDNSGQMEIRVGGTSIRNHQFTNNKNNDGASDTTSSFSLQIGTKVRLTTGQQVRFYAFLGTGESPTTVHDTFNLDTGVHAEFEIVRVL